MRLRNRRRSAIGAVVLGLLGLTPIGLGLGGQAASAATVNPGDGTSSPTAGASCWGIKQQYPASTNGTYWLLTPAMDRPAQFYCDMTTQGGGWVLVARGRQGWTFNAKGQGSPATLRNTVDGPDAFAPAALDAATIDALRNNSILSAEPDGIRLERALNSSGTTRQDYRLFSKARTWTWSFPSGQLLNSVRIDGTNYNGSNTQDTYGSVQGQSTNGLNRVTDKRRLITTSISAHNNQTGFGTGNISGGSNSATNYLWIYNRESNPIPFTRVWLRPQIPNGVSGYQSIPSAGFPEQPKPSNLKDRSQLAPWGVTGIDHTGEASNTAWYVNVLAVKVVGDRVLVGGKFTGVQNGPGAAQISQPSLAAFDLAGNWISSFRPQIQGGRVWDIVQAPNGKVIIAGDFTSVNGAADTSNIAMIDPVTGELDPTWRASATYPGGNSLVGALEVRGDWLYAVGRFHRIKGGAAPDIPVTNAVNIRLSSGTPGFWKPQLPAVGQDVAVSNDGLRVQIAGRFNAVNGNTNHGFFAITDSTTGAPLPGYGPYQRSAGTADKDRFQQATAETVDGNLLIGGSQHTLQMYNPNRTSILQSHITKSGGDYQAIEIFDGYVYASCHCMNWDYTGTNDWSNPNNYQRVDPIRMVGRYDEHTLEYDTSWYPNGTKGSNDEGVWAIDMDAQKCMWVGGDLIRGAYSGNAATDYLGGFARFCPTDATAPTAPTNLQVAPDQAGVNLTWGASTDDSGSVSYDVYRNDRVIAQVWGTSYRDTSFSGSMNGVRYTVRASDARGNRSASPVPVTVDTPTPPIDVPVQFGTAWRYSDSGSDLGTGWRANAYDDSTWGTGAAPLGWGGAEATTVGAGHPTTTYFRRSFQVTDPSAVKAIELDSLLSQGAVFYVNGIEAGRFNMPDGKVTASTIASAYVCCAEDARIKSFVLPGSLLVAGTNTVAVELHGWRANSARVSFDGRITLRGATGDTTAPSAPVLSATRNADSIDLSWTASTDDRAVTAYLLSRGGSPVAVVGGSATSFRDGDVDMAQPASYVVTAFDANGNSATSNTLNTYPSSTRTLVGWGSVWSFDGSGNLPAPGDWTAASFDDSGWASGAGGFGWGDPFAVTQTSAAAPRPLTTYFRSSFNIDDPARYTTLTLQVVAHAGAVVYVNGVEVGRVNMPDGPVGPNTYSLPVRPAADRKIPVQFVVPASMLTSGKNVVTAEMHLNYRSQPSGYFDSQVVGEG